MKIRKEEKYVAPRTGATHGLFGLKYLKRHNMRDINWTTNDLITQYERLSNIFRKANRVTELQKEQNELNSSERYRGLKKELKDKRAMLQILLKGDQQRTKNILQDHPIYQRVYRNMQSYEVLEELEYQAFAQRRTYDRYMSERNNLMTEYEKQLMEVANYQETIRYYDITEFKEERRTKQLLVDLKNSETRSRAIQKLNSSYKQIINQLLHDALYYKPVLDALNGDWNEQTLLVNQTFDIGSPAIHNVKKLGKELKALKKVVKKEENERFEEITKNRKILKEQPKVVKKLVRHDSDFSLLGTHYDRDTPSMTDLKTQTAKVEGTIKMLKGATLRGTAEEIFPKVESQSRYNGRIKQKMAKRETIRDETRKKEEIAKFVHDLLLDDLPQIYREEKLHEIFELEESIQSEKKKQRKHSDHLAKRGEVAMTLRLAAQHMLDVLRHVGYPEYYKNLEFPTVNLQLPVLKFNSSLPPVPMVMETDTAKLLTSLKSRVQLLMQHFQKNTNPDAVKQTSTLFQQAMIEDAVRIFRPKVPSFDYD